MSHVIMCDTCGELKSVHDPKVDVYNRTVRKSEQGIAEQQQFHICHDCTGGQAASARPRLSSRKAPKALADGID